MAADCPVDTLKASRPARAHTIAPAPGLLPWTREIAILEVVGTDLAVSLWKILRRIRLWMEAEPEKRTALFEIDKKTARQRLGFACVDAPDLVEAFGTFALLIRVPDRIEAHQVAEACHQVREWAEEHSLTDAAMLFAEAAAMVEPERAAHANIAGRLCRRSAQDERSRTWYQRAYRLAARSRDRDEQIRALLGYGGLMYHLGNHAEARRYNEQAVGVARNYGRRAKAAEAKP